MTGTDGLDRDLLTMLLGLVLYRAGGEQSFTANEIDEIKLLVGGIRVGYVEEGSKIVLRTRPIEPPTPAA